METVKPRFFEFGNYRVDARRRVLTRNGDQIALASRNFDLLLYLLENEGRIVEHDELLEKVWPATFVEQSNLKKGVWSLRKVLNDAPHDDFYIKTIPRQGYSFVAPVKALPDDELRALRLRETELVLETEEIEETMRGPARAGSYRTTVIAGTALLLLIVGAALYLLWLPPSSGRSAVGSFDKSEITRLTALGNLVGVVISPDGNYAVYATHSDEGQSLWLKHIASGNATQLVAPARVAYYSWTFTPDGAFIYFVRKNHTDGSQGIFRIPFIGGDERKISDSAGGNLTFSPDGSRLAFIRVSSNTLAIVTADVEGNNEREIREPGGRVWSMKWAPDGKSLLYTKQHTDGAATVYSAEEVSVDDGATRIVITPQEQRLRCAEWLADKSGLVLNAEDPDTQALQLWYQAYPAGERRQLTNDLNSYQFFSLNRAQDALVSLRESFVSGLSVADADGQNLRLVVPQSSVAGNPSWLPDGRMVFSSSESGTAEIWLANADGTSKKRLTFSSSGRNFCPSVSADGKTIVFSSTRTGKTQIWRMDTGGRDLAQLTDHDSVSCARLSPDGLTLFYRAWIAPTGWTLFRRSMNEENAQAITNGEIGAWDISPDGKLLVYEFKDTTGPRVALRSLEDGSTVKDLDITIEYDNLRFTPDAKGVSYATKRDGRNIVFLQPVTGGPAKQIADLGSDLTYFHDWSRDGKRLAIAHGSHFTDAVKIAFGKR